MARVLGIHEVELHPGVTDEQFEHFVRDIVYPSTWLRGVSVLFLRGDRGTRNGKYLAIEEFESVDLRDHHFPASGQLSDEAQVFWTSLTPLVEKWRSLGSVPGEMVFTDYVVVDK